jgi:hypothetical protein
MLDVGSVEGIVLKKEIGRQRNEGKVQRADERYETKVTQPRPDRSVVSTSPMRNAGKRTKEPLLLIAVNRASIPCEVVNRLRKKVNCVKREKRNRCTLERR